ncbi:MAG: CRISPR-associated endonuclease Cas1 [Puniceicoccaceae bacterium]
MPVVYLTFPGLKARVSGERLELEPPPDAAEDLFNKRRWIPLLDIDQIVIDAACHLSSHSITTLLGRGIPVFFLAHGDMPAGLALPFTRQTGILAQQIDRCRDDAFRLRRSKELIEAKVSNMRRVLQRLGAGRGCVSPTVDYLRALRAQIYGAQTLDTLRGVEGVATARYFEVYGTYFPKNLPFEKRSRRPPRNPPNAILSFLYTLLGNEIVLQLRAVGLEPAWGVLHEHEDGRPSLALDLLEPFRAPVVDSTVLDLINHKRLTRDDFETTEEGGVLLRSKSRRKVFVAWEDRLEREFHYTHSGTRTTIRNQLRDHALQIKRSFREDCPLQPFRMN